MRYTTVVYDEWFHKSAFMIINKNVVKGKETSMKCFKKYVQNVLQRMVEEIGIYNGIVMLSSRGLL